jgi:hypothetical protein
LSWLDRQASFASSDLPISWAAAGDIGCGDRPALNRLRQNHLAGKFYRGHQQFWHLGAFAGAKDVVSAAQ